MACLQSEQSLTRFLIHYNAGNLKNLENGEEKSSENGEESQRFIKVYLRIKPMKIEHIDNRINTKNYELSEKTLLTYYINQKQEEINTAYIFTDILRPLDNQEKVFDTAVRSQLQKFLHGENILLFSYGTSSSGKSYTIQGTATGPGIIPRVLYSIFQSIEGKKDEVGYLCPERASSVVLLGEKDVERNQRDKIKMLEYARMRLSTKPRREVLNRSTDTLRAFSFTDMQYKFVGMHKIPIKDNGATIYSVWLSFAEVYNETVYDLLVEPDERKPLQLAEDLDKNYYIKGLKHIFINSWAEAYELYRYGKNRLHVSTTTLNKKSSRSHCMLIIKLLSRPTKDVTTYYGFSSFVICDLAGSERQKRSGNVGQRLRESHSINTSLLALNRCMQIMRENQLKSEKLKVPFRDSKLTRLFKKSLSGDGIVAMITNMSQEEDLFFDTQSILRMSAIAIEMKVKSLSPDKFMPNKFSLFRPLKLNDQLSEGEDGENKADCKLCNRYQDKIKQLENALREDKPRINKLSIQKLENLLDRTRKENLNYEITIHRGVFTLKTIFDLNRKSNSLEDLINEAVKKYQVRGELIAGVEEEYRKIENRLKVVEEENAKLRGMIYQLETDLQLVRELEENRKETDSIYDEESDTNRPVVARKIKER